MYPLLMTSTTPSPYVSLSVNSPITTRSAFSLHGYQRIKRNPGSVPVLLRTFAFFTI